MRERGEREREREGTILVRAMQRERQLGAVCEHQRSEGEGLRSNMFSFRRAIFRVLVLDWEVTFFSL